MDSTMCFTFQGFLISMINEELYPLKNMSKASEKDSNYAALSGMKSKRVKQLLTDITRSSTFLLYFMLMLNKL